MWGYHTHSSLTSTTFSQNERLNAEIARVDDGGLRAWTDDYSDIMGAMLRKKLGK